jgi:hypothetical protein
MADYFLNRMKKKRIISNPFFSNNLLKKNQVCTDIFIRLLHSVHFRKILLGYFCFLVLIGQYLSRNWLLNI